MNLINIIRFPYSIKLNEGAPEYKSNIINKFS